MEFFNNARIQNVRIPKFVKIALGGAAVCTFFKSFYNVDRGHRAIVFNRIHGIKDEVYSEGTHFLIPWIERPIIYDVRAYPHHFEGTLYNADGQMVNIGLHVLSRPMIEQLPMISRTLAKNCNDSYLSAIIHEILNDVVAQHNASQLITQREAIFLKIKEMLIQRALDVKIALDDISITNLSFGKEFTEAMEAKQVSRVVEKVEKDQKSAIIRAQDLNLKSTTRLKN